MRRQATPSSRWTWPGRDPGSDPAQVTLANYTDAVLGALEATPAPALLVGHSLGGLSISTAAQARPQHVRGLVYLCAAVPQDGQPLSAGPANDDVAAQVRSDDNGRSFYFGLEYARAAFYGDCTPRQAEHALRRLVRQPLRPLHEPVQLSAARFGSIAKHYILTRQDTMIPPAMQATYAAALGAVQMHELDCGHSPFYARPRQLVELLRSIAAAAPARTSSWPR